MTRTPPLLPAVFSTHAWLFKAPCRRFSKLSFGGEIRLAGINVDEYLEFYESELATLAADYPADDANGYGTIWGLEPALSVVTEHLVFAGTDFGKLSANLDFEPNRWKLNLQANYAQGSLLLFEDRQTPLLKLNSMDLNQIQNLLPKQDSNRVGQVFTGPGRSAQSAIRHRIHYPEWH